MKAEVFVQLINNAGIDYFTGVPDSQLSAFTDVVTVKYGSNNPSHHIVAANEGGAVGLAAGYHLASGKTPCIYMRNSGLGNAVNPITSLLHTDVYGIGCLFVIGYRGQPDTKDEPQHIFMGKITLPLLDVLDIEYLVLSATTNEQEFEKSFNLLCRRLHKGQSIAIVVEKNALAQEQKPEYTNNYLLNRESVIECITSLTTPLDVVVSTTGKISRELYEARKRQGRNSGEDFLTVGSMGHCSSIALAIATQKPDRRIIALDGDGAVLMHMGAMALIGNQNPSNFVHILLDNSAHETVGGMPTVSSSVDLCQIALSSGYSSAVQISPSATLEQATKTLSDVFQSPCSGATFIRIPVAIASRADLARPKERPQDNKLCFMSSLQNTQD